MARYVQQSAEALLVALHIFFNKPFTANPKQTSSNSNGLPSPITSTIWISASAPTSSNGLWLDTKESIK